MPEDAVRRGEVSDAIARFKVFRATMPQVPLDELLMMRHERHRY